MSNSFIDEQGRILFFGLEDFKQGIAKGDLCFICGAKPTSIEFNNEHVIPDWILKKYNLYDDRLTLPNGTKIRYAQYTVPCCVRCNSDLGEVYEKRISQVLNGGYKSLAQKIENDKSFVRLLFKWMSLIFMKTHLKDKYLYKERDRRKGKGRIADEFYWEEMHHIHCVARSHYTGAELERGVYGTIIIYRALITDAWGSFDYVDSQWGKTVMIQLGDIAIICVLNDSCAGLSIFGNELMKVTGKLSPFQLREIVAHLNFINLNLKKRPTFQSVISESGKYKIIAEHPEIVELTDESERVVTHGHFLRYYVEPFIGEIKNKEEILTQIEEGKRSYLFNERGEFLKNEL